MPSGSRKVLGVTTEHWYIYLITLACSWGNIYMVRMDGTADLIVSSLLTALPGL